MYDLRVHVRESSFASYTKDAQPLTAAIEYQYALNPAFAEAAIATGIGSPGRIAEVCHGNRYSANGFVFRFEDEALSPDEIRKLLQPKLQHSNYGQNSKMAVVEIDIASGQVINTYSSQHEAAEKSGLKQNTISRDCARTSLTKQFKRKTIFQKASTYKESPFYKSPQLN